MTRKSNIVSLPGIVEKMSRRSRHRQEPNTMRHGTTPSLELAWKTLNKEKLKASRATSSALTLKQLRDIRHTIEECTHLKMEIEDLIQMGYLGGYHREDRHPEERRLEDQRKITPHEALEALRDVRTIFTGPGVGGDTHKGRDRYAKEVRRPPMAMSLEQRLQKNSKEESYSVTFTEEDTDLDPTVKEEVHAEPDEEIEELVIFEHSLKVLKIGRGLYEALKRHNMEVYVDDMLVKTKKAEDLIKDLDETFTTLRKYKIKLNPAKCVFGVLSGKFLLDEEGSQGVLEGSTSNGEERWKLHVDGVSNDGGSGEGVVVMTSPRGKRCIMRCNLGSRLPIMKLNMKLCWLAYTWEES
uniref:Reverse transcriptase domain-containing protein n=1 Tax=Cannabis sativa TaxID=3483 RepID=A0A803PE18_CANSA